jgi:hypothetical protein
MIRGLVDELSTSLQFGDGHHLAEVVDKFLFPFTDPMEAIGTRDGQ